MKIQTHVAQIVHKIEEKNLLEIGTAHASFRPVQHPPGLVAQYGPGKSSACPLTKTMHISNVPMPSAIFNCGNRSIVLQSQLAFT